MNLRSLRIDDANNMYEWMSNKNVTQYLHQDYSHYQIDDAKKFIKQAEWLLNEKHLAIVNDFDEYMGTVSLRHIDQVNGVAELAIVVREKAMGKGYAWFAMLSMLEISFVNYGLEKVYWRVSKDNIRANRFFMKHGFNLLDEDIPEDIKTKHSNEKNLNWYAVRKGDDYKNETISRGEVCDCKIVKIKTVPTIEAGELSFFEANKDIGFDIKRIYYISKVPEGVRRGFHAHKQLKQLLFCPFGSIQLILENKDKREEITLSDPSIGVVIDQPTWREMLWLEKNSVLVVAASDYYSVEDYIRDYSDFRRYVKGL